MKRFVKCLLMPAVVIAGMILVGADSAEARRRIRRPVAPVIVSPHYYYHYLRPYRRPPGFHVYAPGVHVDISPWGQFYGYGYRSTFVTPGIYMGW